jgi:hypothetical protein
VLWCPLVVAVLLTPLGKLEKSKPFLPKKCPIVLFKKRPRDR